MTAYNDRLADYVDVAERITAFRDKHPDGSLAAEIMRWPEKDFPFVVMRAKAYRSADDQRPGVGWAMERMPGSTPYTRDSEIMNAETSAWGRAIVAALAADTKRGIASRDEIRQVEVPPESAPARQRRARASGGGVDAKEQTETGKAPEVPASAPPEEESASGGGVAHGPAVDTEVAAAPARPPATVADIKKLMGILGVAPNQARQKLGMKLTLEEMQGRPVLLNAWRDRLDNMLRQGTLA